RSTATGLLHDSLTWLQPGERVEVIGVPHNSYSLTPTLIHGCLQLFTAAAMSPDAGKRSGTGDRQAQPPSTRVSLYRTATQDHMSAWSNGFYRSTILSSEIRPQANSNGVHDRFVRRCHCWHKRAQTRRICS